jgi:hypothetical protein
MNTKNEQQVIWGINKDEHDQIVIEGTGYEPSVQIKRTYLPLRKKERLWGGVKYPGLIDYDPANDAGWFWFTVILEVISLAITYFLLEEQELDGSILLLGTICLFCLDFAFAYFHHRDKSLKCLVENQMRLFLPEMRPGNMNGPYANYLSHLEQKLKDDVDVAYTRFIATFLLILLSVIKASIFLIAAAASVWFEAQTKQSQAPALIVLVIVASYLWIAYNHVMHTGYFMASFINRRKVSKESAAYYRNVAGQSNVNERQIKDHQIDLKEIVKLILSDTTNPYLIHLARKSPEALEEDIQKGLKEIQVQPHGVNKVAGQENIYTMNIYGLLTDDQIQKMIDVQDTQLAKLAVAMCGHKLQMQSGHFEAN